MIAASSYSIDTFLTFKALCHVRTGGNGFCTAGSPPWHHAQAHRAVLLAGDRFCTFARIDISTEIVVANNKGNASCEEENFKHGEHDDDGIELCHLQKQEVCVDRNK